MDTDHSEYLTRKVRIDILLKEQGWVVGDRSRVIEEVDSKQSDFSAKDYKVRDETFQQPGEHRYIDYLILDRNGEPLAVIEAKKSGRDPIAGQKQAEDYLKDIKGKYKRDVFIYLSNGYEIWFWNYGHSGLRQVRSFHSREDLEKFRFQNSEKRKFHEAPIKREIINRPYQIEAVKRVQEGMDKEKRKFLIVMATGTGKTRVSMAIIDTLLQTNRIKNVLFLADRRALRDQAYGSKGFKAFFPNEAKSKILSGTIDKSARLFVSTIQTLAEIYQEKDENGQNKISPGFFDLIVSDEAHRSIYNKWKGVFTYFDCYQVGLTATPAEEIERDTFRFFECEDNAPTFNYSFDEAVKDGWLVDFRVQKARTHFQIKGITQTDIPTELKEKLIAEEGLDEGELNWDGSELEKKVATKGTSEAIAKEFMENCLTDESGTLPAKSIIFAISHKHAKRIWEAFERLYPQYKGKLVQIIDYQMERSDELLKQFTDEKWPRIAISVDMLDTGVDVPEVCNLVFAKPVFSKIKFWQMVGRGSRNDETCKHKDWIPDGKKDYFLIFDFWTNFEYFKMNPEGKKTQNSEAITTRIFRARLDQYKLLSKTKNTELLEKVKKRIIDNVKSLPVDSASLRDHSQTLEKVLDNNFWENVGLDQYEYLRKKVSPLMRFMPDVNLDKASFEMKVEKLRLAILEKDEKALERGKEGIGEKLNCLPTTIRQVKAKEKELKRVLAPSFWKNPTMEDTDMLETEFMDLMQFARSEAFEPIVLDIDDVVEERDWIEYGPEGEGDYVKNYRGKVEKKIKELAEKHPTIQKIKKDKIITENDLKELEKTLNGPDLYITEEALRKLYAKNRGSLVQFVKIVIGLYQFPDSKKRIEEAFKAYAVEKNYLNADQVNFLRTLQTVFTSKEHIEMTDFYEPPFTNLGTNVPSPLFNKTELQDMLQFCEKIELEVFHSA